MSRLKGALRHDSQGAGHCPTKLNDDELVVRVGNTCTLNAESLDPEDESQTQKAGQASTVIDMRDITACKRPVKSM